MALTQHNLDALDLAIASGELTVSFNGRTVTYQSTDALLRARDHIARLLRAQLAPKKPTFGGRAYAVSRFNND